MEGLIQLKTHTLSCTAKQHKPSLPFTKQLCKHSKWLLQQLTQDLFLPNFCSFAKNNLYLLLLTLLRVERHLPEGTLLRFHLWLIHNVFYLQKEAQTPKQGTRLHTEWDKNERKVLIVTVTEIH